MIYELRIYTPQPGRMEDLQTRFRDAVCQLFEKHGITDIGYWTRSSGDNGDELWYVLGHENASSMEESWKAFFADPAWKAALEASEVNGPLVSKVVQHILTPTDFSPLT